MRDWVLAGCAIIGALIYLYADSQLPLVRIGDPLGPKIFPAIIGGGLLLSGLLLMLETYRKRQQVASVSVAPSPAHLPRGSPAAGSPARHAGLDGRSIISPSSRSAIWSPRSSSCSAC